MQPQGLGRREFSASLGLAGCAPSKRPDAIDPWSSAPANNLNGLWLSRLLQASAIDSCGQAVRPLWIDAELLRKLTGARS